MTDQAQMRVMAEQIIEAYEARHGNEIAHLIDNQIKASVVDLENRVNRRLLGAILANAIPMIIGAFFLGGLWVKFSDVPAVLEGRGRWMSNTETRLNAMEDHAMRTDPEYRKPETFILPD